MSLAHGFNFDNTMSILIKLRANVDWEAFGSIKIEAGGEPVKPGSIILVVLRGTREHGGGGERRRAVKILNEKHDESAQGASLIGTVAQTTLLNPS
jgi:hypothetical protein